MPGQVLFSARLCGVSGPKRLHPCLRLAEQLGGPTCVMPAAASRSGVLPRPTLTSVSCPPPCSQHWLVDAAAVSGMQVHLNATAPPLLPPQPTLCGGRCSCRAPLPCSGSSTSSPCPPALVGAVHAVHLLLRVAICRLLLAGSSASSPCPVESVSKLAGVVGGLPYWLRVLALHSGGAGPPSCCSVLPTFN